MENHLQVYNLQVFQEHYLTLCYITCTLHDCVIIMCEYISYGWFSRGACKSIASVYSYIAHTKCVVVQFSVVKQPCSKREHCTLVRWRFTYRPLHVRVRVRTCRCVAVRQEQFPLYFALSWSSSVASVQRHPYQFQTGFYNSTGLSVYCRNPTKPSYRNEFYCRIWCIFLAHVCSSWIRVNVVLEETEVVVTKNERGRSWERHSYLRHSICASHFEVFVSPTVSVPSSFVCHQQFSVPPFSKSITSYFSFWTVCVSCIR